MGFSIGLLNSELSFHLKHFPCLSLNDNRWNEKISSF